MRVIRKPDIVKDVLQHRGAHILSASKQTDVWYRLEILGYVLYIDLTYVAAFLCKSRYNFGSCSIIIDDRFFRDTQNLFFYEHTFIYLFSELETISSRQMRYARRNNTTGTCIEHVVTLIVIFNEKKLLATI